MLDPFRFQTINVDLKAKPDWFLDIHPAGKVPTLILEEGDVVFESLMVCDLLDEKYPEPKLHPLDPIQKAKDKMLLDGFGKVSQTEVAIVLASISFYDIFFRPYQFILA